MQVRKFWIISKKTKQETTYNDLYFVHILSKYTRPFDCQLMLYHPKLQQVVHKITFECPKRSLTTYERRCDIFIDYCSLYLTLLPLFNWFVDFVPSDILLLVNFMHVAFILIQNKVNKVTL